MLARARGPALSGGGVMAGSSRPVPLTSVTIEPPSGQAVVVPPFVNTPDGSCPPRHCCDICLRKQPMRASSIVAAYYHLVRQKDLLHLGLHVDVVGRDVPVQRGAPCSQQRSAVTARTSHSPSQPALRCSRSKPQHSPWPGLHVYPFALQIGAVQSPLPCGTQPGE